MNFIHYVPHDTVHILWSVVIGSQKDFVKAVCFTFFLNRLLV